MRQILYVAFSIFVAYFIYEHLIPFLYSKYTLWKASRIINKLAKNHKGQTKKALEELSSEFKKVNKEIKL